MKYYLFYKCNKQSNFELVNMAVAFQCILQPTTTWHMIGCWR